MTELADVIDSFQRIVDHPPTAEVLAPTIVTIASRIAKSTGASVQLKVVNGVVMTTFYGRNAGPASQLLRKEIDSAGPAIRDIIVDSVEMMLP